LHNWRRRDPKIGSFVWCPWRRREERRSVSERLALNLGLF